MKYDVRSALCDMGHDEAVVFDGHSFDDAIIGVTDDGRVVYDYDAMVRSLMKSSNLTEDAAIEFIEYNTIRALPYTKNAPVIMYRLFEEVESHG